MSSLFGFDGNLKTNIFLRNIFKVWFLLSIFLLSLWLDKVFFEVVFIKFFKAFKKIFNCVLNENYFVDYKKN
jgi:hypothetical protein